jgi:hypothetical protein
MSLLRSTMEGGGAANGIPLNVAIPSATTPVTVPAVTFAMSIVPPPARQPEWPMSIHV